MSAHDWRQGIYAITDATLLADDAQLLSGCQAALRGGLALLQYRDKSGDDELRWRQARALAPLCETYGVPLIVNDDLALAQRLRAEGFSGVGLHLGQRDGSLREARKRLGLDAIIGATCHARLDFAERAAADGASYLAFGRFFASRTKPEAPPASLELLAQVGRFGLPRVAIGGIDSDNASMVHAAGADLLATVHAVFGGADPEARVRELNRCLKSHAPEFIHRT
ncbi:MAG TPA: thiamine phosphate synthase [Modicisalibacter sp.]|nr:thiamine phosphate synthase [Modicisalibacter sp.]